MWGDEIASTLARDLDAKVIYEARAGLEGRFETRIGFKDVKIPDTPEDVEEENEKERVMTSNSTSLGRVKSRPGTMENRGGGSKGGKRPNTMYGRRAEREKEEEDLDSEEEEERKQMEMRPSSQPLPNTRIKKREESIGLTDTLSVSRDVPDAVWLRNQAMDKLALGLDDEAQRLFGEAAKLLVEEEPHKRTNGFAYGRHVHEAADIIQAMCKRR